MPSGYFIILKNISDTYILTIFDTVMAVDTEYEPMPAYYDYLKGFRITWYLQDNGTLDFTRTGVINDKKYQPIDISNRFDPKGDRIECFTIRGQRITSGSYLGSYIIIERDTKGMIRKRVLYLK
jgi:hypothetical protein